jgi:hypothetical protein
MFKFQIWFIHKDLVTVGFICIEIINYPVTMNKLNYCNMLRKGCYLCNRQITLKLASGTN